MTNTPTGNFGYNKPSLGSRGWGVPTLNDNLDAIDADLAAEHRSDSGNHGKHGPKVTIVQTGDDNALTVNQTSTTATAFVVDIINSSPGTGFHIIQSNAGNALFIEKVAGFGNAAVTISNSGTGFGMNMQQSTTTNTSAMLVMNNSSIGECLLLQQKGDAPAITVNQTTTTATSSVINILNSGSGDVLNITNNGAVSRCINLVQGSSNVRSVMLITNNGTLGHGIAINNSSTAATGNGINITSSGSGWDIKGTTGTWGATKDGIIACMGVTGPNLTGATGIQGVTGLGIIGGTGLQGVTGLGGSGGLQAAYDSGQSIEESAIGAAISVSQTNATSSNDAIDITTSGSGYGLSITAPGSNPKGVLITVGSTNTASAGNIGLAVVGRAGAVSSGALLQVRRGFTLPDTGNPGMVELQQSTTTGAPQIMLVIKEDSGGHATGVVHVVATLGSNQAKLLHLQQGATSAQSTANCLLIDNSSTGTAEVILLNNSGTGAGIKLNQFGNGIALNLNRTSTAATVSVIDITNSGSGISINIAQSSTVNPGLVMGGGANTVRMATARTITNSADAGTTGDICWDSGFIYICVAASTWKRATLATW